MTRRLSNADLERRLRREAGDEPSLSPGFAGRLRGRLNEAAPADRAARAPMRWGALLPAGALAAAGLAVAIVLVRPPQQATAPVVTSARVEAAEALAVVRSLPPAPQAFASSMSRGQAQLADEAQKLLADARQLASPLISPWGAVAAAKR